MLGWKVSRWGTNQTMKHLILPSLVLLVALLCLGCVGNTPEATLLKGLEAYRDGDWWGSIHYFKIYIEKWPEHSMHSEALFYLADCNFNAGQTQPAEDYFRQFLAAAPEHAFANRARLSLAMILEANSRTLEKDGKQDEAAAAWKEAQDLLRGVSTLTDPVLAVLADQATVHLANSQFIHGNTGEAMLLFERRLAKAERGMARAVVESASLNPAAAAIADPTDAMIWIDSLQQVATLSAVAQDWDKARACLEKIASATFIVPNERLRTFIAIAATFRTQHRIDEAIGIYHRMQRELTAEQVEMATTLTILSQRFVADTYINAGSLEEATRVLDSVYDLCKEIYKNPGDNRELAVYAGMNKAEIELIRGATAEAENTLTQILLDYPSTGLTLQAEQNLRSLRQLMNPPADATAVESASPAGIGADSPLKDVKTGP